MVKVVVLDVDGTLMDTNYLHTEAWARAFEEAGHRVPFEDHVLAVDTARHTDAAVSHAPPRRDPSGIPESEAAGSGRDRSRVRRR